MGGKRGLAGGRHRVVRVAQPPYRLKPHHLKQVSGSLGPSAIAMRNNSLLQAALTRRKGCHEVHLPVLVQISKADFGDVCGPDNSDEEIARCKAVDEFCRRVEKRKVLITGYHSYLSSTKMHASRGIRCAAHAVDKEIPVVTESKHVERQLQT